MDLISVIVPIYKVEKYLRKCVDSVLNQTYQDLEIILVDDGSPDNCGEICDEYAKKDNRIKVIHKVNGGLSDARNAGIDIAQGNFISFIDSDDFVSNTFIEKLYNSCMKNNTDISQCEYLKFQDNIKQNGADKIINEDIVCGPNDMLFSMYGKQHVNAIVVWNKLYRKHLFDNIRFPKGKINEDEFTTYKLFYNANNGISTINEKLYFYRQNDESIMGKKFNVSRYDKLEALEERKQFFKEREMLDLYNKTDKLYMHYIKHFYVLTKVYIEDSKKYQKMLMDKYKKNFYNALKNKEISKKEKIKDIIFIICPYISYFNFKRRQINAK